MGNGIYGRILPGLRWAPPPTPGPEPGVVEVMGRGRQAARVVGLPGGEVGVPVRVLKRDELAVFHAAVCPPGALCPASLARLAPSPRMASRRTGDPARLPAGRIHQTPYSTDVSYSAVRPPANCTPHSPGVYPGDSLSPSRVLIHTR